MFFPNLLCTVTLATLASAAAAKQIPTPYTSEQSESNSGDMLKREAEPEPARTAVWEQSHGGAAPTYKFGEQHDAHAWHIAREANPMPEADAEAEPGWANVGGNRQKKPGHWGHAAREAEAEAEPGWANVGGNRQKKPGNWGSWVPEGVKKPFTKGGPSKFKNLLSNHPRDEADAEEDVDVNEAPAGLLARDPRPEDLDIPDFGDQVVDTSLKGLLDRRDADDDDDDDEEDGYDGEQTELASDGSKADLSGYDPKVLQSRSGSTAGEIDYSLEGYEAETFENQEEEKESRPATSLKIKSPPTTSTSTATSTESSSPAAASPSAASETIFKTPSTTVSTREMWARSMSQFLISATRLSIPRSEAWTCPPATSRAKTLRQTITARTSTSRSRATTTPLCRRAELMNR
jgi:hypothetical protein